jgi:hypothetical protein
MRREFTTKVKVAAWHRCEGRCESCTAKLYPGRFAYDHDNPDGLTGEPTLENCRVLCSACHGVKTKGDVARIAKAKRCEAKHVGARTRKGRPLLGTKASGVRRHMDGTVGRWP